jgi:crotonobetainyl-CoA:carnitine CoA-transferase CaiB-like acyl-CoA transferase
MPQLAQAIARLPRDAVMARLDAHGVPCGPVRNIDEVLADAHTEARRMVREFDHPVVGAFKGLPLPFKFDGFDQPGFARPPLLGEHTAAVLADLLGYDAARISGLKQEGAI